MRDDETPAQYVATTGVMPYEPTFGKRYLFGTLERRELSVETRVDYWLGL